MAVAYVIEKYHLPLEQLSSWCLQTAKNEAPFSPDPFLLDSWRYYRNGDYRKAIALVREALKIDAHYAQLWVNLGLYQLSAGQFDEAKDYNENALTPFKLAINEIFTTMAFLNLEFVDVYNAPGLFHFSDVAGIMNLGGREPGSIVITMTDELARKLISNILAIPSDELDVSDIEDGVAELINMVAGGAKARITDEKQHFLLSAPSILTGKEDDQSLTNNSNSLILQYKVEGHFFAIEICLSSMHS